MGKAEIIFSLHLAVLIFSCFHRWDTLPNFIKCLTLTQSYWGDTDTAFAYNWVEWFLSSILLSFFLAPLINLVCEKLSDYAVAFAVIITGMIFAWAFLFRHSPEAYGVGYYYTYIFPPVRTLEFIMGALLSKIYKQNENKQLKFNYDYFEYSAVLLLCIVLLCCDSISQIFTWTAVWVPLSCAAVYMFARNKGKITRILNCKFASFMGTVSFELFIIHRMVLAAAAKINTSPVFWCICVAFCVLSAYVWHETALLIRTGRKNGITEIS